MTELEIRSEVERIVRELDTYERARMNRECPRIANCEEYWINSYKPRCKEKKAYWNIDLGSSGAWMVEKTTGNLFGIKGYGVPDRKKYYGPVNLIEGHRLIRYRWHKPTTKTPVLANVHGPQRTFWEAVPERVAV